VELFHVGEAADMPEIPDADLPGARLARLARPGVPDAEIAARATETDADLVVLASAGREGVMDALTGSVTARVLARTTTPLLAVPAA
jgi:nucleotide-binding universal stress UspA family protein